MRAPQAQHNGTLAYSFDGVGNRTQRLSTMPALPNTSHSFNDLDQPNDESYDLNGNLTRSADGRTFTYDFEDRLKTATTASGVTTSYSYDGNGNRVAKTTGSQTTRYLNGNLNINVAEELVNGQVTRAYTHGNAPIGQRPASPALGGQPSFFQRAPSTVWAGTRANSAKRAAVSSKTLYVKIRLSDNVMA